MTGYSEADDKDNKRRDGCSNLIPTLYFKDLTYEVQSSATSVYNFFASFSVASLQKLDSY